MLHLSKLTTLPWDETKKSAQKAQLQATRQFIQQYQKCKDRKGDKFLWGDEVEYFFVKFDDKNKTAKALLKAESLLQEAETILVESNHTELHAELVSFQIESIPKKPYTSVVDGCVAIETSMRKRRNTIRKLLGENEEIFTITNFPRNGCENFTSPEYRPDQKTSEMRSLFFPDEAIFQTYPRMKLFMKHSQERRETNPVINIPIFKDTNAPCPFREDFTALGDDGRAALSALPDHIYLDTACFSAYCSLQVTMQCADLEEAKYLFDQLVPLSPIMLALAAAAPIYRGYLSEYDCRWGVQLQAADDRTTSELQFNKTNHEQIRCRWGSVEGYLSEANKHYNLTNLYYNKETYRMLLESGVDEGIARHIAYILIRDPLYLYKEDIDKLEEDCDDTTDIFENFNTSVWQTVRLKKPPREENSGWKIEFRPMDVQLTDKENAAYCVFMVLLSRAILEYRLDFVVPISMVDTNMDVAYKRDAIRQEKFYFRDNTLSKFKPNPYIQNMSPASNDTINKEMTINEIVNGIEGQSRGLVSIVSKYIDELTADPHTHQLLKEYVSIISARASGDLKSGAKWIRDFVAVHPSYKRDSFVSEEINYDLLKTIQELSNNDSKETILFYNYN